MVAAELIIIMGSVLFVIEKNFVVHMTLSLDSLVRLVVSGAPLRVGPSARILSGARLSLTLSTVWNTFSLRDSGSGNRLLLRRSRNYLDRVFTEIFLGKVLIIQFNVVDFSREKELNRW